MSYEDGFEALKNGDFRTAVALLERAAHETGYTSDIINHAYTLSLYRCGDKDRLANVAFEVGSSLRVTDPASAMDYFQRAISAGLDGSRVRDIGRLFEQWASPMRPLLPPSLRDPVSRVAHVVGCLRSDHPPAQYLKMLVSSLKKQVIESTIFTTEWAASWFFNPAGVPLSQPVDIDAELKIASVDGDFEERARRVAEALRGSGLEVAFFHASLGEQITARVASLRPILVQVNVNHDSEMDADLFHGRIHLYQNAMQRARFSDPAEWIPIVSDIETRLRMNEPVTRQSMGLESASSITATFGNLDHVAGRDYLRALAEIMKRFPKHFHLFAGAGNVKVIRPYLHSEGVLPRVRFLGQVGDTSPLLDMVDVYLSSFPSTDAHCILDAMGAGKPVVVLRHPADSRHNSAAELVGIRELMARGEADYIDITDRLLRHPELRAKQQKAVLDRFRAEFQPGRLGERYKSFLTRLLTDLKGGVKA
jgi:glycosyltransferase involved in cell wall biosynthesis